LFERHVQTVYLESNALIASCPQIECIANLLIIPLTPVHYVRLENSTTELLRKLSSNILYVHAILSGYSALTRQHRKCRRVCIGLRNSPGCPFLQDIHVVWLFFRDGTVLDLLLPTSDVSTLERSGFSGVYTVSVDVDTVTVDVVVWA
jgi:hypothetical protein